MWCDCVTVEPTFLVKKNMDVIQDTKTLPVVTGGTTETGESPSGISKAGQSAKLSQPNFSICLVRSRAKRVSGAYIAERPRRKT